MTRLRRSDPAAPGWGRRRAGSGFSYRDDQGVPLHGADRQRCEALAIPPAWTDVWICPWPNGHVQAIGTDAAGRRQYLYHSAWREDRDRAKFARMLAFGEALPAARATAARHLGLEGMPRERALAVGFGFLDRAGLRVGGESYAREHGSVGVATLRKEHATTSRGRVHVDFPGKSGRQHDLTIDDPELAAAVHVLLARRSGGPELLAFRQDGRWVDVTSGDVNGYVHELMGSEVSAKDFRTWLGTVAALESLAGAGEPTRSTLVQAMRDVADRLGNTPAVARSAYVDPRVVAHFLAGDELPMARRRGKATGLDEAENELLTLLRGFAE